MAAVIESVEPVNTVHMDGLAVLKILKHCQESLPNLVTGSLLGLSQGNGILEITHAFPFPEPLDSNNSNNDASDDATTPTNENNPTSSTNNPTTSTSTTEAADLDGHDFQLEMMKMLREVNVDNNCVGWYQSTLLGSYSTTFLLENQLSYQTDQDLSPNAVVMLYDPIQTSHGKLSLKCFRLTKEAIRHKTSSSNKYMDSKHIFEEVPIVISNSSLVQALLHDMANGSYEAEKIGGAGAAGRLTVGGGSHDSSRDRNGTGNRMVGESNGNGGGGGTGWLRSNDASSRFGTDTTFDRLDLGTDDYLEKHLDMMGTWVDDLTSEQSKFQYFARGLKEMSSSKEKDMGKKKSNSNSNSNTNTNSVNVEAAWEGKDAPRRLESLLVTNQLRTYCDQMDGFTKGGFGKLFLAGGLHNDGMSSSSVVEEDKEE